LQQRRQAQKAAQPSAAAMAGSRRKRSSSRSPQFVVSPPQTQAKTKAAAIKSPPMKTAPAQAVSPAKAARAGNGARPTSKGAAKAASVAKATNAAPRPHNQIAAPPVVDLTAQPLRVLDEALAEGGTESDAMARTSQATIEPPQQPEIPETPDMPDVPETPEVPEEPDVPQTPETPEIPDTPGLPETPEEPEVPDIPAIPEEPEQPPAQPEGPETEAFEPDTPDQPDAPAVRAAESPAATTTPAERRMPTLAVMAHPRREPAASGQLENSVDIGADAIDVIHAPDALEDSSSVPAAPAMDAPETPPREPPEQPLDAVAPTSRTFRGIGRAARRVYQPASAVTRPVTGRSGNRRRKLPRTPDLIWEDDPRLPGLPWPLRRQNSNRPHPLPPADALIPVVVVQIFLMAGLGMIGALLGLYNQNASGSWALVGALIAGLGGAIAYALSEIATLKRYAPYVLVASQLGLLAWSLCVFGPRASILALVPAFVEIVLLMGGTLLAGMLAVGALLTYALFAGLAISVGIRPVSELNPTGSVIFDVVCVVIGLLATLWLLLAIQAGRERAQAMARARRHEADILRNLVTQFRQEAQDDTGRLESALLQALKGQGIEPIPMEGMYRLLAETIMDTASRLEVLQRDREERLRLEGSLRVVVHALERQWLGVDPEWPGQTGTAVDEIVALLRTPPLGVTYHNATQTPTNTPRLIPIPTLASERDTPLPTPISRPVDGATWLSPRRARRPDLYPLPSAEDEQFYGEFADEHGQNPSVWNARRFWSFPDDD
jgi:hypothetical protein